MKKYYIVYQITNKLNDHVYIGQHVTDNINDNYMGSGKNINKAIKEFGIENFEKIILFNFDNKEDMIAKEAELVNEEFIRREDTYNIITGGGFNTTGMVNVKDKKGNYYFVYTNNPRYLSGELVHIAAGTVPAKDTKGNYYQVSKEDPRYLSGDLFHPTTGMVVVKDKDGNTSRVPKEDIRYISGELISVARGTLTVKDKDGNYYQVSIDDPKYLSGELVPLWKNRKHNDESKKKIGQKNSIHQKGSGNSQYGTCWIYNDELQESKKIKKDELNSNLINGWKKGRKLKF